MTEIHTVRKICYSPTGTTRNILDAIVQGTDLPQTKAWDFTRPGVRDRHPDISATELVLMGVPVYYGRVPDLATGYLKSLRVQEVPVVLVVVYGNREFEDALLELSHISRKAGFVPIAGGAFIGEHSFSSVENPIAHGRPDNADLACAQTFGTEIRKMLAGADPRLQGTDLALPGNMPYRAKSDVFRISPHVDSDTCLVCGRCAEVCPAGVIDEADVTLSDDTKCTFCCACIKECPSGARKAADKALADITAKLFHMCRERKEPQLFMA